MQYISVPYIFLVKNYQHFFWAGVETGKVVGAMAAMARRRTEAVPVPSHDAAAEVHSPVLLAITLTSSKIGCQSNIY
jgi:hypothetical protein